MNQRLQRENESSREEAEPVRWGSNEPSHPEGIRVTDHVIGRPPWQRGGNESSGSGRISAVNRGDDDGTKPQVREGLQLQADVAGNGLAMFQVRVSLWTWGFKSPLAHKLVEGS